MLTATHLRQFGSSTLRSTIFLERRFRANLVNRDRLLFHTRYSPPAKKASPFVHVYASLRGSFEPEGKPAVTGPHCFVLAETEFDRVLPTSMSFRSWGDPCAIVELRVPAADMRRPIGMVNGPVELPTNVWDAYLALEQQRGTEQLHELIVRLGEAGILSTDLTSSVVKKEPERFERLWEVLRPLYEDLATSASLKQIAIVAKLSLRQLGRDLGDLTRTFGLFGAGFRDAMRVLRLRAAVLLLSAPGASPSDVAKTVGYGSLDAMGRAFRDASLPAPSVVQEYVRYPA